MSDFSVCVRSMLLLTCLASLTERVEGLNTTEKRITTEVSCLVIEWTEHRSGSCDLVNVTIADLDGEDPPRWNLSVGQYFADFKQFHGSDEFTGTCFVNGFALGLEVAELSHQRISWRHRNGSSTEPRSTCQEGSVYLYEAEVTNVTDGCLVHPLGLHLKPCSAKRRQVHVTTDVTLQYVNDTHFLVATKKSKKTETETDDSARCDIAPGYNDTQYDFILSRDKCNTLEMFPPPNGCLDTNRNSFAWSACSRVAFGLQVFHLDQRFDDVTFRNMTSFCQVTYPTMRGCLGVNHTLCPSGHDGGRYARLQKSYEQICSHQHDFTEGSRCMERIAGSKSLNSSYAGEMDKCTPTTTATTTTATPTTTADEDICRPYSESVLCSAYAQYMADVNCTDFGTTYTYKRLVEDRNKAWQIDCLAEELDPCTKKVVMDYQRVCSGCRLVVSLATATTILLPAAILLQTWGPT